MPFTYDDDETSVQDGEPVELITFAYPGGTSRYAGGDVAILTDVGDGTGIQTFVIAAVQTGQRQLVGVTDDRELEVVIPVSDPVAQTYLAFGPPPRELLITVYRYMTRSGQSQRVWGGYASGLSCNKHEASFRVPNGTEDALAVQLPTAVLQLSCNAFLYDKRCTLAIASFTTSTTITGISADGKTITVAAVASSGGTPPYYQYGILEHVTTTEKRSIVAQNGLQLTINLPLRSSPQIGDPIKISAGCDHTVRTCHDKFANVPNFRGAPMAQLSNPFIVGVDVNRTH